MDGFYMTSCRTTGMAPSDVIRGIRDGTVQICPYKMLRTDQVDEILDGFLHRGYGPRDNTTPRCMNVTSLGRNYSGMPLARIEMNTPTGSHAMTPAVCTYCPESDSDCFIRGMDLYDALKDDPLWNADIFDDEAED